MRSANPAGFVIAAPLPRRRCVAHRRFFIRENPHSINRFRRPATLQHGQKIDIPVIEQLRIRRGGYQDTAITVLPYSAVFSCGDAMGLTATSSKPPFIIRTLNASGRS
jgi:hypothetical protein